MQRFVLACVLLLMVSALCPATSCAQDAATDDFTLKIRDLADQFAKIITKKGGGTVIVGAFEPATGTDGSVAPRIREQMIAELQRLQVAMVNKEPFDFEMKGDYQKVTSRINGNSLLAVKLTGRLIERETADILAEKPTTLIVGPESVSTMNGLNTSLDGLTTPAEQLKAVFDASRPANAGGSGFFLNGPRLSIRADSKYAVEVLVKSGTGYEPRNMTTINDNPFVELATDAKYAVRLINRSNVSAAVDLRVDGVSSFRFSDTGAEFWIIEPKSSVDVLGWHRSNDKTVEFRVVSSFKDSAAFQVNLSENETGLITAAFRAAWEPGSAPPADEPGLVAENGARERKATGFGDEIKFQTRQVNLIIGAPRDILSVRYDRK
jgi:hypothetical protein